jgi:hypothetical protein
MRVRIRRLKGTNGAKMDAFKEYQDQMKIGSMKILLK